MPCHSVRLPEGGAAIICTGRSPRCACGRPGTRQCDWKVEGKKSGTCDRWICELCTYVPAPDKDLCGAHAADWKARLQAKEPKGPSGVVQSSYLTRAHERVYIIAWDDKVSRPLTDVDAEGELPDGARVRLIGRTLRRAT